MHSWHWLSGARALASGACALGGGDCPQAWRNRRKRHQRGARVLTVTRRAGAWDT